jgi:alpha-N-acetylglucosaminidase
MSIDTTLQKTSAYNYDLVDVARQVIANHSRVLLPRIESAFKSGDLHLFRELTQRWLNEIQLLDRLAAAEPSLLLGRWLAFARAAAKNPEDQAQFEFDARSLLLEWGSETSRASGVHDYANREWNGLLEHYRDRWATYFSMLDESLEKHTPVHEIDWFALDQDWARQKREFPVQPRGDAYETVKEIWNEQRRS